MKGDFGHVAGGAPWNKDPLYLQATEGQRQELDAAMDRVDRATDSFEHIQSYGQDVMDDISRFCGKCENLRTGKMGVDSEAPVKEFKDVECRMDLHVLGAREILRRYDEEYIPEVVRECSVSDCSEDTRYLSNVQKRRQDLSDRLSVLQGAQAAVRKAWAPFSGQTTPETQCAVSVLRQIVLKKPANP